jgi:hypothetical protein
MSPWKSSLKDIGATAGGSMDHRNSLEITAPVVPIPDGARRPSRVVDARGTRRTMMRVMQRKSVGTVVVYEQDPNVDTAGKRALVFESTDFRTRVENFPADWQRLTDDELSKLRHSAN